MPFIISVRSDSELKIKEMVKNKWIVSSFILCILILIIVIIRLVLV